MMCMISASTGINGESLAHHLLNKHNDLTFIEYFLNGHCEGTFVKSSFPEESPKKPHGCQNCPKPPEKVLLHSLFL